MFVTFRLVIGVADTRVQYNDDKTYHVLILLARLTCSLKRQGRYGRRCHLNFHIILPRNDNDIIIEFASATTAAVTITTDVVFVVDAAVVVVNASILDAVATSIVVVVVAFTSIATSIAAVAITHHVVVAVTNVVGRVLVTGTYL